MDEIYRMRDQNVDLGRIVDELRDKMVALRGAAQKRPVGEGAGRTDRPVVEARI